MKYKVKLNGKIYEVEVEKGKAELLSEYDAISAPVQNKAENNPAPISAPVETAVSGSQAPSSGAFPSPLPGTIVDIKVSVGQQVKRGDLIIVIEAMKMENEITSPKDGKVTAIYVQKGVKVEQNTPLIEIV